MSKSKIVESCYSFHLVLNCIQNAGCDDFIYLFQLFTFRFGSFLLKRARFECNHESEIVVVELSREQVQGLQV